MSMKTMRRKGRRSLVWWRRMLLAAGALMRRILHRMVVVCLYDLAVPYLWIFLRVESGYVGIREEL